MFDSDMYYDKDKWSEIVDFDEVASGDHLVMPLEPSIERVLMETPESVARSYKLTVAETNLKRTEINEMMIKNSELGYLSFFREIKGVKI